MASRIITSTLQVDGGSLCEFNVLRDDVLRQSKEGEVRFWQGFYNLAATANQLGWKHPWPELFYEEDYYTGLTEFEKYFEIIDGYITPRSN